MKFIKVWTNLGFLRYGFGLQCWWGCEQLEKPLRAEVKKENRIVSDWLLYYHDRLKEYEDYKESIALYPAQAMADEGHSNTISDPTQRVALKRLDFKHNPEWFNLIAELERRIPEKQRVFLEVRREAKDKHTNYRGRPAWVPYVQCRYPLVMAERTGRGAEEFYISQPRVFYDWWNRLVEYGVRLAIKRGLLRDEM